MELNNNDSNEMLNDNVRGALNTLVSSNALYNKWYSLSIILDVIALVLLLYGIFNYYGNSYKFLYYMCAAALLTRYGTIILKQPKEKLKKAQENLKDKLLFDVCSCQEHCHCRRHLEGQLKEAGIKL